MKKILTFILCVIFLIGCNKNTNDCANHDTIMLVEASDSMAVFRPVAEETTLIDKNIPEHSIHNRKRDRFVIDSKEIFKVTYTVIIPSKYNLEQLNNIARHLITNEDIEDNVFISYYLKGDKPQGPNYAISSRVDGLYDTTINYVPPVTETFNFNSILNGESKNIIGRWEALGNNILILYKRDGKYFGLFCWGVDSYNGPFDYIKTNYKGKTAYYCPDAPEEMFVLGSGGTLLVYGNGKYITTYQPIK